MNLDLSDSKAYALSTILPFKEALKLQMTSSYLMERGSLPGTGKPRKRNGLRQNRRKGAGKFTLESEFRVMSKHPVKSYSGILLPYTSFHITYS